MKYIFCCINILCTFSLFAQSNNKVDQIGTDTPFVLGVTKKIYSNVLHEDRTLNIYLPQGYKTDDTAHYPVIYLLDGSADEDFIHISGLVQFFTMLQLMPKTIVVGIANIDRLRDFTYPTIVAKDKKAYPTTGGSAKFISFLEKELEPFITHTYRTSDSRTIIGQSLGGLLATEVLLKKPDLFNHYIIVSPSLWWSKETLLNEAPRLLKQMPADSSITIYLAMGNEGPMMVPQVTKLAQDIKDTHNTKLHIFFDPIMGENHLTILHYSVYRAFEKMFVKKETK